MSIRDEKIRGQIIQLASDFLILESNRKSMITVTNVEGDHDFKKVIISVTVFPENQEKAVMDFLRRRRSDFKAFVRNNSRINRVPFFDFMIDQGDKARLRIDEISRDIEEDVSGDDDSLKIA